MIGIGGDTSLHDHEYDYVSWFDLQEALAVMRYPNEADLVRRVSTGAADAAEQSG
jgi:hypothetical protein